MEQAHPTASADERGEAACPATVDDEPFAHQDPIASRGVAANGDDEPKGGAQFDRLTQMLEAFFSRRRLGREGAGLLVTVGWATSAAAKKEQKKHGDAGNGSFSPACDSGFAYLAGTCVCPSGLTCDTACCAAEEQCLESGCCPAGQTCESACCSQGAACIHGECCPPLQVCDGECCTSGEVCADKGGAAAKECCANAITVRGETCCPSGSGNLYFCGQFRCLGYLSGTGPGGCDMWCKVGDERSYCGTGVNGFPVDPGLGCCCTDIAEPDMCTYPFPGPI